MLDKDTDGWIILKWILKDVSCAVWKLHAEYDWRKTFIWHVFTCLWYSDILAYMIELAQLCRHTAVLLWTGQSVYYLKLNKKLIIHFWHKAFSSDLIFYCSVSFAIRCSMVICILTGIIIFPRMLSAFTWHACQVEGVFWILACHCLCC